MKNTIPTQFRGKKLDYVKSIDSPSLDKAQQHYEAIKQKLMDVNNWHHLTQGPSAEFRVVDSMGNILERAVREGDFIRIDIPGPGVPSAGGYDWVRVEELVSDEKESGKWTKITLRPCADPTGDNEDTAHFFQKIATSTFLVEQLERRITVRYAGRNEVINTENESALDNFRNFVVGITAKIGASYPQWKLLVDGLTEANDPQGRTNEDA